MTNRFSLQSRRTEYRTNLEHTVFTGHRRAGLGDATIFDGSTAEKMPAGRLYFHREFNRVWPGRYAKAIVTISRGTAWSGGSSNGVRAAFASIVPGNADKVPNARLGAAGENTAAVGSNVKLRIAMPTKVWIPYGDFLVVLQFDGHSAGNSQTIFTPDLEAYASTISGNFYSKKASEGGADYAYSGGIPATFSQTVGNYANGSGASPADILISVEWDK